MIDCWIIRKVVYKFLKNCYVCVGVSFKKCVNIQFIHVKDDSRILQLNNNNINKSYSSFVI